MVILFFAHSPTKKPGFFFSLSICSIVSNFESDTCLSCLLLGCRNQIIKIMNKQSKCLVNSLDPVKTVISCDFMKNVIGFTV